MKYIRDDSLAEVLPNLARMPGYNIEIIDNETRKMIDTRTNFIPSDYKVIEIRMNDMFLKYEVFVVKKEK